MASDAHARAAAVLTALEPLSDLALAQAADAVGGPGGELLRALARARQSEDPEAAAIAALEQANLDEAQLRAMAARVAAFILAEKPAVVPTLDQLFPEQARAALGKARVEAPDIGDPALAELVEQGLDLLGPAGPLGQAAAGAAEVEAAQRTLREVAAGLAADPGAPVDAERVQQALASLRAQRDQLQDAARQLGQVDQLLRSLADMAMDAGRHLDAARLFQARAGLLERLDAPADQVEDALEDALEAAALGESLPLFRQVARLLQLRAVERRDLAAVGALADRVATLARAQDDAAVEIGALCEAAVVLAQLPAGRPDAVARAGRAVARAQEVDRPALLAQARLAQAQVLEKLGELSEARRAFRRLVRDGAETPTAFPYELGWACLHLGRLEAGAGQVQRARDDLALAAGIAGKLRDWLLYGLACQARFDLAQEVGDRDLALRVLRDLDGEGATLGGARAAALRQELGARLAP